MQFVTNERCTKTGQVPLDSGIRLCQAGECSHSRPDLVVVQVLTSLGPFFIKLGQALAIRPDILSPQVQSRILEMRL